MNPSLPEMVCNYRRPGVRGFAEFPVGGFADHNDVLTALRSSDFEVVKRGRNILAVRGGEVFIKEYFHRRFLRRLRYNFKYPRSFRCLRCAAFLDCIGVETPKVLVALRIRSFMLVDEDILVTELIPDDFKFANELATSVPDAKLGDLAYGCAALLAKLHASGAVHGDMNVRNIYCREKDGFFTDFGLIDLDAMRVGRVPVALDVATMECARLFTSFELLRPDVAWLRDRVVSAYSAKSGTVVDVELFNRWCGRFREHRRRYEK
ncbi:MAG: hypothetical protein MJ025_02695 [Victivallaceae bacterium]|nr:hypothetical protein [Victivallaceae bacterium]